MIKENQWSYHCANTIDAGKKSTSNKILPNKKCIQEIIASVQIILSYKLIIDRFDVNECMR